MVLAVRWSLRGLQWPNRNHWQRTSPTAVQRHGRERDRCRPAGYRRPGQRHLWAGRQSDAFGASNRPQRDHLRTGAVLAAPEVFLVASDGAGNIEIETGAGINTIGRGHAAFDSSDGFVYAPGTVAYLPSRTAGWTLSRPRERMTPVGKHRGRCMRASAMHGRNTVVFRRHHRAGDRQGFRIRRLCPLRDAQFVAGRGPSMWAAPRPWPMPQVAMSCPQV